MKKQKITLNDASGGYNDLVTPAGLAAQELAILENYYTDNHGVFLQKRNGQELAQYAPVDAQPYTVDPNTTLALWHLDEPQGAHVWDSEINNANYELRSVALTKRPDDGITAISGLFPIGNPTGKTFAKIDQTDPTNNITGGVLISNPIPSALDGLAAVTFDAWIKIPTGYSGGPVATNPVNGVNVPIADLANTNLALIGSAQYKKPVANGLTINRDFDFALNKDISAPYATLNLSLASGTTVTLKTNDLPTNNAWLHIRGEYDSTTGIANLYVNGALTNTQTIPGNKPLSETGGDYGFVMGGRFVGRYGGTDYWTGWEGVIDEVRVSTTVFPPNVGNWMPFKLPRGQGFEFAKSDGTRQAVVAAEGGLFYTIGNGEWTKMGDGFSDTAYWDAVFYKDVLYLANGVDAPKAWDGKILTDWGNPTIAPQVLADGNGQVAIGTHLFAYSYVYGDYETGLSPVTTYVAANNNQLSIYGIPGRLNNCTSIRIYVTKGNATDWYLIREVPNIYNGTIELRGAATVNGAYDTDTGNFNVKDSDLKAPGYPPIAVEVLSAQAPNPKYLLAAHDRLFVCGMANETYTLRWSELGTPDVFNALGFVKAATNKGNLIALAEYYGEIHASKDGNATLVLRGDSPAQWSLLETLHPNIGCIDHWGYVHRYLVNEDRYTLCFPSRDGFYEYAGQQIQKISDRIRTTIEGLKQGVSTRDEWDVQNTPEFQAQLTGNNNGLATQNIASPTYEQDGMRETINQVGIVNQLDYIGLWGATAPLVNGNVIAVAKADGEGAFWFSTDADNVLYFTPDNFVTVQPHATQMDANERIIEIARRGTDNYWYLFTDTADGAQSSGGGKIWKYDGTTDVFNLINAGPFYYNNDISLTMWPGTGNDFRVLQTNQQVFPMSDPQTDPKAWDYFGSAGMGPPFTNPFWTICPSAVFINHNQTVEFSCSTYIGGGYAPIYSEQVSSINGYPSSLSNYDFVSTGTSLFSAIFPKSFAKGFWYIAFPTDGNAPKGFSVFSTFRGFDAKMQYTRREFPTWRGGTYRPQAYWDATNNRLLFLASTPPDSYQNTYGKLRILDGSSEGVTTISTTASICSFATDGVKLWTAEQYKISIAVNQANGPGTIGQIREYTLAAPSTLVNLRQWTDYDVIIRMAYDATSNNLLVTQKALNIYGTQDQKNATQDYWTYRDTTKTIVVNPNAITGPASKILEFTANGDSGPVLREFAKQTTAPYPMLAVIDKPDTAALYSFSADNNTPLVATIQEPKIYANPTTEVPVTGVLSNLLFVPNSGIAGGNLWADRLYWMASSDSGNGRFVQHGLPGIWTVKGYFRSETHNLGKFDGFETIQSTFNNLRNTNGVLYYLRNQVDIVTTLATPFTPVQPNTKINGFNPAYPIVQWELDFTWNFDYTKGINSTKSPYVKNVNLSYFLGDANMPRIIGAHYNNRTYWAVATSNSDKNNLVLVYQKNGTWAKVTNWEMTSMFMFRNLFFGCSDYRFLRLEAGATDDGALIKGRARTGQIIGPVDKLLTGIQANVSSLVNTLSPSASGWVKIVPCVGSTPLDDSAWLVQIPNGSIVEPQRILGVPKDDDFKYDWIRSMALEIRTSEDTKGDYVALTPQPEEIQSVDVTLELTGETYDLPVK